MIFPRAKVKSNLSQTNFKNWFGNVVELQCTLVVYRGLKQVLIEEYFQHKKNLKDFSSCSRCGGITIWVLSCPTGDPLWEKQREKAVKPFFFIHSVLNCSHTALLKDCHSSSMLIEEGNERSLTFIFHILQQTQRESVMTDKERERDRAKWLVRCVFEHICK